MYKIYFAVLLFISISLVLIYSLRLPVVSVVLQAFKTDTTHPISQDQELFSKIEATAKSNNTLDNLVARMEQVASSKGGIDVNKTKTESEKRKNEAYEQAIIDGVKNVRNVPPYPYIMGTNGQNILGNASCAPFPNLFEIRFTNTNWQSQTGPSWTYHIMTAYWDNRELNAGGPSVRILGIADRVVENVTAFCQIWFEHEKSPKIFPVVDFDLSWKYGVPDHRKYNGVIPYIWNCPVRLGENDTLPLSVSVVENICDAATTNVKISYEKPPKKEKVAICVRAMNFPDSDVSIKLIEWIEIVKLLGAQKVFLYQQNVHPNISKVYEYYKHSEFLDVVTITFPEGLPNDASLTRALDLKGGLRAWITEILPLNDCLYRNMYKYEYLAVIDIDEIIVPNLSKSWQELLENLEKTYGLVSSFAFRNTFYHPEVSLEADEEIFFGIPPYLNMIQEVYRGCESRPRGAGTKCFHNTSKVKILHNHYPFECLGSCNTAEVNSSFSDVHHHRFGQLEFKFCDNDTFVIDTSLWKWKDKIIENASFVIKKLHLA